MSWAVGILQRITNAIRSPWRQDGILEQVTYQALFGDVSEVYVSRQRALALPVVAKANRIAKTTVAKLPLTAKRKDGTPWEAGAIPIVEQIERGTPSSVTLGNTVDALMFHPWAWWQITERDSYGWPSKVRYVPEPEADYDDQGTLVGAFGEKVRDGYIRFDGFTAGMLREHATIIRRALVLERVAAYAEENPVPSIELHNTGETMSGTQIDELIARWKNRRQNGNVAYTSKWLEVNTHGQAPEQLLIDSRRRMDLELARATGAPAWIVDAPVEGQALNYSNRASRNWELIDLFLSPVMTVIEDRLSMGDVTPRGTTVKFETDELTRPDMKTRFETYEIGKRGQFITDDWIKTQEGWR